jgi:hypothetical protein
MKTRHRTLWLGLLATAPFAAGTAWASIKSAIPPAKTVGTVSYIDGGRAPAQAKAMNKEASNYPLELLFLWGRGQKETPIYGVQWSIKDAAGHELLDKSSGGPEVLASLPNGRYTVTAHYHETSLSRAVTVHRGQHDEVVLEWAS